MNLRQISILFACAVPGLSFAQISIYDAAVRLEASARSGASFDPQTFNVTSVGPQQNYFQQIDAYASSPSPVPFPNSSVHSWSNVGWNCTPFDLTAGVAACWDSQDYGAGNSGHMLGRLTLGIRLAAVNIVSTSAVFDPPNSTMEIEKWTGTSWIPWVTSSQIVNYTGIWNPGDYRLRTQRLYNPVGNSTDCAPYDFRLHAEPVPEPSTTLALITGATLLIRRRKVRQA